MFGKENSSLLIIEFFKIYYCLRFSKEHLQVLDIFKSSRGKDRNVHETKQILSVKTNTFETFVFFDMCA